jgi:hypothetical protein
MKRDELPPGFGLRQPSGALDGYAVTKAVEGHRSPRRYRANASFLRFMISVHDFTTEEAFREPGFGRDGAARRPYHLRMAS